MMLMLQRPFTSSKNMWTLSFMTIPYILILVVSLCSVDGYSSSMYSETGKFEHSCPELDSCKYQRPVEGKQLLTEERNCACDYSCNKYGDCCFDAPRIKSSRNHMKCYEVEGVGGVYMIGNCPAVYEGDEDWRELCEQTEIADPSDPIGTMPITDNNTGITYKNVYCKMCNGKLELTCFWNPKLECPLLPLFNESKTITDDYVLQNLILDKGTWGLNVVTEENSKFFLDCFINPVVPLELKRKIRPCKPNLVSDCPPSWKDEKIRRMCNSYMAPRYTEEDDGYTNVHCAICNNVNVTDLSCRSREFEDLDIFRFSAPHSFAILLDVSLSKGDRVGMIRLCNPGAVFDPFFHRCRTLLCLPGFIRRGRRCYPNIGKLILQIVRRPAAFPKLFVTTTKPPTASYSVSSTAVELFENTRNNLTYNQEPNTTSPLASKATSTFQAEFSETFSNNITEYRTASPAIAEDITSERTSSITVNIQAELSKTDGNNVPDKGYLAVHF